MREIQRTERLKRWISFLLISVLLVSQNLFPLRIYAAEQKPSLSFIYNGSETGESLTIEVDPDTKITTDATAQGISVSGTYDENSYDVTMERTSGEAELQLASGESADVVYTAQAVSKEDASVADQNTLTVTYQASAEEAQVESEAQTEDENTISTTAAAAAASPDTETESAETDADVETVNVYIRELSTQLFRGAQKQDDGRYVWNVPTTGDNAYAAGHQFAFRINFATSGVGMIPADYLHITIPKSIITKRDGSQGDTYEMSIPSEAEVKAAEDGTGEAIDEDMNYAYRESEDGKSIIIYNFREVPAGDNTAIEVGYSTNDTSFAYLDNGDNADFTAHMEVLHSTATETTVKDAEPIKTAIDTTAKINSTNKKLPNKYNSWQPEWGNDIKPENEGDYYYLVWQVVSNVTATQPYNFSFADAVKGWHGTSKADMTEGETPMEVVGYKFSGGTWQKEASVSNQTLTDDRYDYVMTSIPKEEYDQYTYWFTENTITATVDPIDQVDADTKADSVRDYVWTKPVFSVPHGHVNVYKRGDASYRLNHDSDSSNDIYFYPNQYCDTMDFKAGDYTRYDLEKFNGYGNEPVTLNQYGGFDYASWAVGYTYPWTVDGDATNIDNYGKKKVKTVLTDEGLYLSDERNIDMLSHNEAFTSGIKLTSDDFRIDTLEFSYYEMDARFNDEEQQFEGTTATYDGSDVISFYGKFGSNDEWVKFGTYTITGPNTGISDFDSAYVKSAEDNKIIFNDSVDLVGYRMETENAKYFTELFSVPFVTLKDSETVKKVLTSDVYSAALVNNTTATWTTQDGAEIATLYDADIDYARAAYKDSSLTKDVVSTKNNVKKKSYTITWKLQERETMVSGENGEKSYIPQDSGVFYDLLPKGAIFDPESVQVLNQSGNEVKAVKTKITDNYKNTGRSLVTFYVNEAADYYDVYFDTRHSWNSIKDFGTDVYNPLAYKTGNDSITNGFADNGGTIMQDGSTNEDAIKDATLMSNLTSTTDDDDATTVKKFLFAEDSYDISALTSASSGLTKKIKAQKDTKYTNSTTTTINGYYSYRLRFQNSYTSASKDMILFDSLENYSATGTSASAEAGDSDWHGTLQSIDVSQIREKGADPVLYISTIENLNIDENNDLKDTSVWTEVTGDTDLSTAKAVAIDFRYKEDGSEFKLGEGDSVTAYLYMKAPDEAPEKDGGVPYAYNNIYIHDQIYDPSDEENAKEFLVHQDYTKIGLKITGSFGLEKTSSENADTKIEGVSFRLFGTSKYGTKVDNIVKTDANGHISFDDIEMGEYVLQEYASTDDWLLDATEHKVVIDNTGKVTIDGRDYTDKDITLTDKPRVHGDLKFQKKNQDDYNITGAQFRLYGTSDYGTDVSMYATSQAGHVTFENIEKGTYSLVETQSPDTVLKSGDTYQVIVDAYGNAAITGIVKDGKLQSDTATDTLEIDSQTIIDTDRYWLFSLRKVDSANKTKYLQGAEFHLTGTSDTGTKIDKTFTTDGNGIITFSDEGKAFLEAGKYVLQETKAPTYKSSDGTKNLSYILDDTKYIVTITKNGAVSIVDEDGNAVDTEDNTGYFIFTNKKEENGKITIIKKWNDGLTGDKATDRPTPTIHLRTSEPDVSGSSDVVSSSLENVENSAKIGSFDSEEETTATLSSEQKSAENPLLKTWNKLTGVVEVKAAENDIASGTWGTCPWTINSDGVLTIGAGTGADTQYSYGAPWDSYCKKVTAVKTEHTVVLPEKSYALFQNFSNCTSMDLSGFDTSNVKYMYNMFGNCSELKSLDVSNFDMSNAIDVSCMFYNCSGLTTIDVTGFNTKNVVYMGGMFNRCSGLTSLDVTHFDTSNVKSLGYMFYNCSSLTGIDLTHFDTRNVTDIEYMFNGCSSLTSLDLSGFNTENVREGYYRENIFQNNDNLSKITFGINWTCSLEDATGTISQSEWRKVRDGNNNKLTDSSKYQLSSITQNTTPNLAGTWIIDGYSEQQQLPDGSIEYISDDDCWTQLDDGTWSYTFSVADDTLKYYVYEDPLDGYTSDTTLPYYQIVGDTKTATITNTSDTPPEEPKTGSLTVSKTVKGTSTDQQFAFQIQLSDTEAAVGTKIYSDVIFENGLATVYLKGGESQTIEGLPDGTDYTVTETPADWFESDSSGSTGTITTGGKATAAFTNTYTPPETTKYSLTLTKKLTGRYEKSGNYAFHIAFCGLDKNMTYSAEDISFTSDDTGNANVDLSLEKDESVVFTGLPEGCTYQITEDAGDYCASYNIAGNAAKSSDQAAGSEMVLTTANETLDGNETVTFTNDLEPKQTLTVCKTFVDADGNEITDGTKFPFTVTFTNMLETDSFKSTVGKVTAEDEAEDGTWTAEKTFYLASGEKAVFSDIPVGVKYTVKELKNDAISSYAFEDGTAGSSSADKNANTKTNTELETQEHTVQDGQNDTVDFTNTKPTTASVKVIKKSADARGKRLAGAEFSVKLGDQTIGTLTTGEDGVSNALDGLEVGKTYIVEETKAPEGYTINPTSKSFTVEEQQAGTTITLTFTDEKLVTLPNTGGDGSSMAAVMSLIGCAIACGFVMMAERKKRQMQG